ncbi:unnamed protein product [Paramecium sonneborni]|uniref:Uncharacterized protein n=1 Tax=Paramecium sonneborni TaxID=65129 RepID=A0A8S1PKQ9_9CILI|nr:unnamed protein product [Paramecium sonneborni]
MQYITCRTQSICYFFNILIGSPLTLLKQLIIFNTKVDQGIQGLQEEENNQHQHI